MDHSFRGEEAVAREVSPVAGGWNAGDYLWNPFEMKAKKIHRSSNPKQKKRGRARGRGPVACQVEGCNRDLANHKEYHQRYKICPVHMKAKWVMKGGIQHRFCQQCGRFHLLSEFDDNKRSCRERLKKHNQRRRKKAITTLKRTGSDRSSTVTQSNCPTDSNIGFEFDESVNNVEMDPAAIASSLFSNLDKNPCYGGIAQVAYDKGASSFVSEAMCCSTNDRSSTGCQATSMSASQAIGGTHHQFDLATPVDSRCYLRNHEDKSVSPCSAIPDQKQFTGTVAAAPLVMPLAGSLFSGYPLMEPVAFIPPKSSPDGIRYGEQCPHNPSQLMYPWNPCLNQESPPARAAICDQVERNAFFRAERVNHECRAMNYKNLLKLTSLSVKVFNCTPGDLPPALKSQLLQAVQGGLVPEGYMRPGCVHLMFDVFQHGYQKVSTLDNIVFNLLSSGCSFWKEHDMMVQTNSASILVSSGKVKETYSLECDSELFPAVNTVHPVCVLTSESSRRFTVKGETFNSIENSSIHCRIHGRFIPVAVDQCDEELASMSFPLNQTLPTGCMKIEVSKNGMIDRSLPVLCVEESNVVSEIESFHSQYSCDLYAFVEELGLAIELRTWLNSVCLRYGVDIVYLRELLMRSVGSFHGRLGFKNATLSELSCCIRSACHVSAYCRQHGLTWTAQYLQPVVSLSVQERIDRPPRLTVAENCTTRQKGSKRCLKFMKLLFQKHEALKSLACF